MHLRLVMDEPDELVDSVEVEVDGGVLAGRELPAKPARLSDMASMVWDEIVEALGERQTLLKRLDATSLEVWSETWARWRRAVEQRLEHGATIETSQGQTTAPWVGIEERASRELRQWAAEFGFSPSAERRLRLDVSSYGDTD